MREAPEGLHAVLVDALNEIYSSVCGADDCGGSPRYVFSLAEGLHARALGAGLMPGACEYARAEALTYVLRYEGVE